MYIFTYIWNNGETFYIDINKSPLKFFCKTKIKEKVHCLTHRGLTTNGNDQTGISVNEIMERLDMKFS